jgi:hypothetical protein
MLDIGREARFYFTLPKIESHRPTPHHPSMNLHFYHNISRYVSQVPLVTQ